MRRALRVLCLLGASGALAQPATPWLEGGQPGDTARSAVALLADAPSHGLDPVDYGVPTLQRMLQEAAGDPRPGGEASSRLPAALDAALRRYLKDLHDGRLAQTPGAGWPERRRARHPPFDAEGALRAAWAAQDLAQAVRQAVPAIPQYERVREALAQYRSLAGHRAWDAPLPAPPVAPDGRGRALQPGRVWSGLPVLAARLAALGDLAAGSETVAGASYDDCLVRAVRAFQQRHGLETDGVVGRATWAALQVRPAQRVRQLELALERLRATPLPPGPRAIVVNIPEFVLRAYERQDMRFAVRSEMKVIVGQALDTRTPLIEEDLRFIEFNPYWNVPASIARKELVPRLRRDPAYWAREGFEFVGAAGLADPVLAEAKLQAVLEGVVRIRQRPGPRNALGDIKFVFPNRESVYLHHTPATQLFERPRRDFSHGCIRVEQPVALAGFALQGLPGWPEERIRQAMADSERIIVTLPQPVPVLIVYATVLVKEGRVHFFDDIYGHDRALDAALRARVRPPVIPPVAGRPEPRA